MNGFRKLLFLMGQVGLMMLARYFFQWIMKFSTESVHTLTAHTQDQTSSTSSILSDPSTLDPLIRLCG